MSKRSMIIIIVTIILMVIVVALIFLNRANKTYAITYTLKDTVIKENKGTTWSSGASGVYEVIYTKADGTTIGKDYRYIGAEPNNYVKFNNDMYQIIGVFDENSHGVAGKQLVKVIRTRLLGAYSWGIHNTSLIDGGQKELSNDWTGSDHTTPANLNVLLNEYFYNKIDISDTYGSCGDWTYYRFSSSGSNYRTINCDNFMLYGIDSKVRNYIQTATFHLNGYNNKNLSKNDFYLCERGLYTGCSSANNGEYDSEINAYVGLLYPSDYKYASGYFSTSNTILATSYYGNQNWLYKGYEATITPKNDTSDYIYAIDYSSNIIEVSSYSNLGIRPLFYLKEDVYVTGGNGTFDNPYTLDCDTCDEN